VSAIAHIASPDSDSFREKAAVRLGEDQLPAWSQYARHLPHHIERLGEVIKGHNAGDAVKGLVGEGELGLLVEVLRLEAAELVVARQLHAGDAHTHDGLHATWEVSRVV